MRVILGALADSGYTYSLLAAEPLSTALLLLPFQCLCGTILMAPYSMVWDWRVLIAGPMLFYWPKLLASFCSLLFSHSLLCFYRLVFVARVFGLIGCSSLSHSLALKTSFNNNNNFAMKKYLLNISFKY